MSLPTSGLRPPQPRLRGATWLALVLSALHAWMAASVSPHFCTTYDELAHVTAGYQYWTADDLRFQPENGNFPQRWAALPLLAMDLHRLPPDHVVFEHADVWNLGDLWFYTLGNDSARMLAAARAMVALLSGALCFLIFTWSRDLFGSVAGLVSVTFAAFSPTLLAHGGLATSDCAAALTFTLAVLAWWRVCHRITFGRIVVAGLAAGLLAVSKFSAVLFAPIALILVLARLSRRAPLPAAAGPRRWRLHGPRRLLALSLVALVAGTIAWTTIWAFYGFRYAPTTDPARTHYIHRWSQLMMEEKPATRLLADGQPASKEPADYSPGVLQAVVTVARQHHLFPEAFLHGLLNVDLYSRSRLAFFAGEYRNRGWYSFFPTAFLLKTTVPTLAGMVLAVGGLFVFARRRGRAYRLLPLIALGAVYGGTILTSHLSIGHRHMLPLYPLVFILLGAACFGVRRHRAGGLLLAALVTGQVYTSIVARPYYLAYFNRLAGDPNHAYRLFVDSTLDWGQDLPGLRAWLDQNQGDTPAFLSYFGSGDPAYEGIRATRFGDSQSDPSVRVVPAAVSGGLFCIGATQFQRVYTPTRGPWSVAFEASYAQTQAWMALNRGRAPDAPFQDLDGQPMTTAQATAQLWRYENLQFGRLCYFLQHREPDAEIGYSILIFRLSDEEVNLALYGSLRDLTTRIESQLR